MKVLLNCPTHGPVHAYPAVGQAAVCPLCEVKACRNGGPNCGKLDCAWGCCWPRDTSASAPTGVVPRVAPAASGFVSVGRVVQRWQSTPGALVHPDLARAALDEVHRIDQQLADPIAQAVDDYLLMERKARAWDELRKAYEFAEDAAALARMDRLVHPAQEPSTR